MNEKLRKKIVIAVFVGAVVWGGFNFFPTKKAVVAPAAQPQSSATADPEILANDMRKDVITNSSINVAKDSHKKWGRDPFINTTKPKEQIVNQTQNKLWKLSGIIYNNQTPSAIINRRPVSVGDIIDDATVKEINKKNVKIELNGKEITLFVNKG